MQMKLYISYNIDMYIVNIITYVLFKAFLLIYLPFSRHVVMSRATTT